jgi:hypothetical protein
MYGTLILYTTPDTAPLPEVCEVFEKFGCPPGIAESVGHELLAWGKRSTRMLDRLTKDPALHRALLAVGINFQVAI